MRGVGRRRGRGSRFAEVLRGGRRRGRREGWVDVGRARRNSGSEGIPAGFVSGLWWFLRRDRRANRGVGHRSCSTSPLRQGPVRPSAPSAESARRQISSASLPSSRQQRTYLTVAVPEHLPLSEARRHPPPTPRTRRPHFSLEPPPPHILPKPLQRPSPRIPPPSVVLAPDTAIWVVGREQGVNHVLVRFGVPDSGLVVLLEAFFLRIPEAV